MNNGELSYWIILFFSLFLSALFSASETALTSAPETFIRKTIENKKVFINPFKMWLYKPNSILTTIIIGNNIVNTLAAVVATVLAQLLFQNNVITIATSLVTITLVIFGEITPKTFARHNAKSIVKYVLYFIYPLYFIFFPAVWLLTYFAVFLVKSLGGQTKRDGPVATEEDIEYLIRLSHEEGVFKKEQGRMLQSVISFQQTVVKEIMVPRTNLASLDADSELVEIMATIAEHGYTRWPVYENDIDHIVGIFYVKDLLHFSLEARNNFRLRNHLKKAIFIPDSMKLDAVLREFQKQKVHLAVVVDEYGGTAGIVTLEDILEEIVGEIRDEYDQEEDELLIKKISENRYIADGRTTLSELNSKSGIKLPSEESFETISGFMVSQAGKIPKPNQIIHFGDWHFRALEVNEKRVIKIDIYKN